MLSSQLYSTNYTSNNNGNWTSLSTWVPVGIPVSGDSIIIIHHVILDTNFICTSGSITINAGGSLIQDSVNRFISVSGGDSTVFTNYGVIEVDSLYNRSKMYNEIGGILMVNSFLNKHICINSHKLTLQKFHNQSGTQFTNYYEMNCNEIVNFSSGFLNKGLIIGINLTNKQRVILNDSTGTIYLSGNLYNSDSTHTWAAINNDGIIEIGGSFYNFNTVSGTSSGSFTIQDSSVNYGSMTGSFDFCDQTPPPTYPYIDWNLGSIDATVTFCGLTTVAELDKSIFNIYPNPTTGMINIGSQQQFVEVYSIDGKLLLQDFTNQIDIENYKSGLYFLIIKDQEGNQLYKEKLIKQ